MPSSSVSSNANYDDFFLSYKLQSESVQISFDFPLQETYPYNLAICADELMLTISKNLRNASPGPDNIHASMIRNFHPNSCFYLISLFHFISLQKIYPPLWKVAIIHPILKPNSDPSLSTSYRPIALTLSLIHISEPTRPY